MQHHCKRLLRVLLLFSFVSLMLCPYAEIITAGHGGKLLIHQDDFKKNRKLLKNEYQSPQIPFFLKTPLFASAHFWSEVCRPLLPPRCRPRGLSITTTMQLLL
jgi:hypothetical protein